MNLNFRKLVPAAAAFLVFALIAFSVAQTAPWQETGQGGAEDMDLLVQALFTDHVIALEVLGILLTAALIGSLVIARPLGATDDERYYDPADVSPVAPTAPPAVPSVASVEVAGEIDDSEEEE